MLFRILHTTRYVYDAPLRGECFMEARLRPLSISDRQRCRAFSLQTDPAAPVFSYDQPDQRGAVHHFVLRDNPHDTLTIHAESEVETSPFNPFADVLLDAADWGALAEPGFAARFAEWLAPTALVPLDPVWPGPPSEPGVFGFAQTLAREIWTQFDYVPGATEISTPLAEFAATRRGVCQDYAHLMLAALRARGIPARYVSGYVAGGSETAGAGATHAWTECFLPHAGIWKGFDPTNNLIAGERHIKVGVGRDYADVPPTRGLVRAARGQPLPATKRLDVQVQVQAQKRDSNGRLEPEDSPTPSGLEADTGSFALGRSDRPSADDTVGRLTKASRNDGSSGPAG